MAAASAGSVAPAASGATQESCEKSCRRIADCRGLNKDAPLIATKCTNECTVLLRGDKALVGDLVACRAKETCEHVADCDTAYDKAVAKTARTPAADDPVVVTKTAVGDDSYGVAKQLTVSYKSNAPKDLDGIKFRYFCSNNFDEPLGSNTLIDQDKHAPGSSASGTWQLYSDNNCTKAKVVVIEVHYADGTTWAP